jgi:hypothetical protein
MRAPKNLVKVKYTMGEKYVDSNFNPYTGYYCELRGKAYPGKVYTGASKPLKLISSLNKSTKINGITFNVSSTYDSEIEFVFRYFVKYINTVPVYIKEINADTYNSIKDNPLYQTTVLKFTVSEKGSPSNGFFDMNEVEQANKKMSGIKLYLQDELF